MKLTWKNKKNNKRPITTISHLPFDQQQQDNTDEERCKAGGDDAATSSSQPPSSTPIDDDTIRLAESFQAQGNKLAEAGKYREALGKWEAAITLMPERATLHEEKAQVLLEIGETWKSLLAATRATELEPSWAEAWVTLGRAQLNYGEPDSAIESFDKALAIKREVQAKMLKKRKRRTSLEASIWTPDSEEAKEDRQTALHLVKKRKQLHSSGLSVSENRYMVGEKTHI